MAGAFDPGDNRTPTTVMPQALALRAIRDAVRRDAVGAKTTPQ
jgi:hypothetical protein